MRIQRVPALRLDGDEGESVVVEWDNEGEPYREFVTLTFDVPSMNELFRLRFDPDEAKKLRDKLNELLP